MKAVSYQPKPRRNRVPGAQAVRLIVAFGVFLALTGTSRAQLPEPPLPVDPRPIAQLITDAEKALLAQSDNPKKLVEAYIKISETHLQAAFDLIVVNNHGAAERELDVYNKAVAAAAKEAFGFQEGKRNLSKRLEQILYRQIKTLEKIDRMFPSEREVFADAALRRTKQLRVQALNAAFDSGGVLNSPDDEKKPKNEPPKKDGPPVIRDESATALSVLRLIRTSIRGPGGVERHSAVPIIIARFENRGGSSQLAGDYLTDEEDEHVREAQVADARAKVFMKIADRRLNAIVGSQTSTGDKKDRKKLEEEEREWGAVPKVSRIELLRHYARAISECMAKLEDAYERNPKSTALPKALSVLRDATDRHLLTLRALKAEMTSETEVAAISGALYEAETANKGARDGLK